jgi:hypothetical protein
MGILPQPSNDTIRVSESHHYHQTMTRRAICAQHTLHAHLRSIGVCDAYSTQRIQKLKVKEPSSPLDTLATHIQIQMQ